MAGKTTPQQTFEQSLSRLEEIVNKLEQGEVALGDAIRLYEEGLALSKTCIEELTQAELKLKKLSKDIDGKFRFLEEEGE